MYWTHFMLTGLSEAYSEPCKTPKMEFLCKNIKIFLAMSGGPKMILESTVTAPQEPSAVQIWRTEHVGTRRHAVIFKSGDFIMMIPSIFVELTWSESPFKE